MADSERRSSEYWIGDVPPEAMPQRPVRVLLSVIDPALRRTLAFGLRLDGHDVCEAEDPVSPHDCLRDAEADVVVCGTSPATVRDRKASGLIVLAGARQTRRALVHDVRDLGRLCEIVRDYGEAA